jgi:type II secretory ATPase GspE/PulE/Tfp pilus assembly ATPase PilB-like protein
MKTTAEKQVAFWRAIGSGIGGGVPLVRVLRAVAADCNDGERAAAASALAAAIEEGRTLSQAMAAATNVFSQCDIAMVEAGEAGGVLDVVVERLAGGIEAGAFPRPGEARSEQPRVFWRAFAELLRSGVPILRCLDLLIAEVVGDRHAAGAQAIRAAVLDGASIAASMRQLDGLFPELICARIDAAEAGGSLAACLLDIVEHADSEPAAAPAAPAANAQQTPLSNADGDEPVVRLVNQIIREGVSRGASDIHIQPEETRLRVRYRIDGVLHEAEPPPKSLERSIIQRLKVMANLDLTERRLPQDGRIQLRWDGREVDLRVSLVPASFAERITLRVLDTRAVVLSLDRMALASGVLAQLRALAQRPTGLVLVTGPGGSGKTTLMYSMLKEVASSETCICTAEHPVEFRVPHTAQTPIQPQIGLTFARAVTAYLRQDPDVIMIGEIRDVDTLNVAVQAALTGHLVVAGMHAPDTVDAVRRLLDLGLEPFLFNSAVAGVVSLRLPRLLCEDCRQSIPAERIELGADASVVLADVESPTFHEAGGCAACGGTGYRGRRAVCEILEPGDALREAVRTRAGDLRAAAATDGLQTLGANALRLAATGATAPAEVLRVVPGAADYLVSVPTPAPAVAPASPEQVPAAQPTPAEPEPAPAEPEPAAAPGAAAPDEAELPPVVRLVNQLLYDGVKRGASDIHLDPTPDGLVVRLRIDGVLRELMPISSADSAAVINRVKVLGALNIAERRLPQDGRLQLRIAHRKYDLRVSVMPVIDGQRAVLRILDPSRLVLETSATGMLPADQARVNRLCAAPHGVIIVNGPTGCGKTTLLYALLNSLNTPERNIMTIEDPVEYTIDGLTQIRVNPSIGLSFTAGLRSLLRHAPNVLMVGELRDLETASIVMQAGMAGHLVLTTLHAQTSVGAIVRLLDMGVRPFIVNAAVHGVITPRLVRRLCTHCRQQVSVPAVTQPDVQEALAALGIAEVFEAVGCDQCYDGYRGRLGIHEVLEVSPALRAAVAAGGAPARLQAAAVADGLETLFQCGLRQAALGNTSLSEALRVTYGRQPL